MKKKLDSMLTERSGWILPLVIGAVSGGFGAMILLSWLGDISPSRSISLDLAAVLLTAVAVIVTVLGVLFAFGAFWGYAEIKKSAQLAAIKHAKEQIENGPLRDYMETAVRDAVIEEIESPSMESRVRRRVDEVLYGNPDVDDELDYVEGDS